MTPNPDVTPVGFAATDAPGASVRLRRNPVWLGLAILLAGAAIAAVALFVVVQTDRAPGRDEAVAAGQVAALGGAEAPAVRFSGAGDYTAWLEVDGVLSNRRETVVAATNCVASFGNGGSARFRGARQGASVMLGDRATIGTFHAPEGAVEVSCRQLRFGHRRNQRLLSRERSFFVAPGKPGVGFALWAGVIAAPGLLFLAAGALRRYRAGALKPR